MIACGGLAALESQKLRGGGSLRLAATIAELRSPIPGVRAPSCAG